MPFLSRNLLYVRRARGAKRVTRKKGQESKDTEPKVKKANVLLDVFQHRTVMYNDALLGSPRRATRKLVQAEISSGTPVKKTAAQGKKKRKRGDDDVNEEDDGSSGDTGQGFEQQQQQKENRTWKEKLAANDKRQNSRNESNGQKKHNSSSGSPQNRRMSISPLSTSSDGLLASAMMPLPGNGDGVYLSTTARAATPILIHYLVLGDNGVPSAYVEERDDRRCPFCFHDAVRFTYM